MALATPARTATAAADTVRKQLTGRSLDPVGRVFWSGLVVSLVAAIGVLLVLIFDVVTGGWGTLSTRLGDFLAGSMGSSAEAAGLAQGIRGTVLIGAFVLVLAVPIGVAAAVYLEEYATKGRFSRFLDINIRNLAGVPSVVYGIFGLSLFVQTLGDHTGPGANGRSVVSAGLTLAILVLPIVIITSIEAVRAVPGELREAAFGVGATHWEVIRHHVLPYAAPGVLTGTILSIGRALGEAAPLILVGATTGYLTSGDSYALDALRDRFTALPILITTWAGRPGAGYREVTAAAIVVLLVLVLIANTAAILLRNRYEKRRR